MASLSVGFRAGFMNDQSIFLTNSRRNCKLQAPGSHAAPSRRGCSCTATASTSTETPRPPVYTLMPPPYDLDALEPHMSKQTLEIHHGKHHRAYVDSLYDLTKHMEAIPYPLEELVKEAYNNGSPYAYFNAAGQVYNHEVFWESMQPNGGGEPEGELMTLIQRDFGSFEKFVKEFKQAGSTQFGSGWAWLVVKPERISWRKVGPGPPSSPYKIGRLAVVKTPNALSPLIYGHIPLLAMDVWEHSYYLDYQNARGAYIDTFLEHLVSWKAVALRLGRAKAFVNMYEPSIPDNARIWDTQPSDGANI